jgi:hypothetical protein
VVNYMMLMRPVLKGLFDSGKTERTTRAHNFSPCGRRQEPRSVLADHRPLAAGTGLIDEIDLHIAPILLGEGIRLYDNPGSEPSRLHRLGRGDPTSVVNVRYRPTTTAKIPTEGVSGN